METRKVKILKYTVAAGEFVEKGKTVDLSPRDAHVLCSIGKAQYVDRETKAEQLTDREMTSETTATSKSKKNK